MELKLSRTEIWAGQAFDQADFSSGLFARLLSLLLLLLRMLRFLIIGLAFGVIVVAGAAPALGKMRARSWLRARRSFHLRVFASTAATTAAAVAMHQTLHVDELQLARTVGRKEHEASVAQVLLLLSLFFLSSLLASDISGPPSPAA